MKNKKEKGNTAKKATRAISTYIVQVTRCSVNPSPLETNFITLPIADLTLFFKYFILVYIIVIFLKHNTELYQSKVARTEMRDCSKQPQNTHNQTFLQTYNYPITQSINTQMSALHPYKKLKKKQLKFTYLIDGHWSYLEISNLSKNRW